MRNHATEGHVNAPGDNTKSRIKQRVFRSRAADTLPLTIHHERVYILPSTRGIAFIGVLAIMLMASINYSLNLGYALCFILIGLFCSCLLSTYRNLVQVKFVHAAANDTFEDTPLVYKIILSDERKRARCSIRICCEQSDDTFDIKANGTAEANLLIKEPKRGIHSLGRLTISSDFPLGLWRAWGYVHTPVTAHVYPKPEHPTVALNNQTSESGGKSKPRVGEQEYQGLKTYENTDSPAHVAWKQAASGRGMYSKKFEAETEQQQVSIRWQDTPSNLAIEQRLSRMASWVNKAISENSIYTFELPGGDFSNSQKSRSGAAYGKSCLRALAAFTSPKPAAE